MEKKNRYFQCYENQVIDKNNDNTTIIISLNLPSRSFTELGKLTKLNLNLNNAL